MENDYQPFGDEWRREINKLPKTFLCEHHKVNPLGMKKKDVIEKIRTQLIVASFNNFHPPGTWLNYRKFSTDDSAVESVRVKSEAFISDSGHPVCFFMGKSGFFSVEPEHIV